MIVVAGMNNPMDITALSTIEKEIYLQKLNSTETYAYDSNAELQFELSLRAKIVEAARALLASKADFASFRKSRCNWKYWIRTELGGFQLRPNVLP